ncbi:hypothetical protein K474DRAFT_1623002 [Panus rudis PR-1116 ss-1]|nr:hypothetical protein K474DRAFT_1623002 [Panus rudis PR-1116 ss-1]
MEFLSQTYIALRGPTGAPQSPSETIARLGDRLSPATLLQDRRAAVLSLKGLSRDCKAEVGQRALHGLVDVLLNDAEVDGDIGKAVLETLSVLCDTNGHPHTNVAAQLRELGYRHTDVVLSDEKVVHKLFALLADTSFYLRLAVVQFLLILLHNRRQLVQSHFLKAAGGATNVLAVIDDKREIIRNEGITLIQALVHQSPDIQKVLAFEGAFERLFNIIKQEGGLEGGHVVHEVLATVDALLRFNSSNQGYFRDTLLPPMLPALLLFPPSLPPGEIAPQGFALQFWDTPQKPANASLVLNIMGMLIGSKGGSTNETMAFSRCMIELALASNAPTFLKTQALRLLPPNLGGIPLPQLVVTPYMPVPETNGEEWDRLEPASALDALVELVLHGEYNGMFSEKRTRDGLELRATALSVFQNFVQQKDDIRETIVRSMLPPEGSQTPPPISPLLHALITPPSSPLSIASVTSTHLACLLFAHFLRGSPRAKSYARTIVPASIPIPTSASHPDSSGNFFVPADTSGSAPPPSAAPPPETPQPEEDDEDDEPQTLLQILSEHLSLAFLSRVRADTSDLEAREWDRLIVGYLTLLIQWLWEDPGCVREFLQAGGLGMLVEPINQMADSDLVIPGLCTFLLGTLYEFNHEPGEVTRATIHPILTRLGVDTLIGRIREMAKDDRFKTIGPDGYVLAYPGVQVVGVGATTSGPGGPSTVAGEVEKEKEGEIWFDWAFVDFWKSNYYTIMKGLAVDPNEVPPSASQNAETSMLVASLRDVIQKQSDEIQQLKKKLDELQSSNSARINQLQQDLKSMQEAFEAADERRKDVEKEQEDLLVLLDEVNMKRRRDKQRMREAGLEVSEDEDEDGLDDDE